jgi:hypothetical protein
MTGNMKFSWKALLLAPLPIPLIYGAVFEISAPGKNPFGGFLILSALSIVLSYGITLFLFLPCLFTVSRFTPLTREIFGPPRNRTRRARVLPCRLAVLPRKR